MRGRMSAVFSLVVTSGPRLGDVESGSVAGAAGVRFSFVSGGLACVLGVGGIVAAFPALWRYGRDSDTGEPTPAGAQTAESESRWPPTSDAVAQPDHTA